MNRGKPQRYLELAERIRRLVEDRGLKGGDALPSERQLARSFEANHLTIRKALAVLEERGFIHKIPSKGSFVGAKPPERSDASLIGVILPDADAFFHRMLIELETRMDRDGFHPVIHYSHGSPEKEERIARRFAAIGVDGIIAAPIGGRGEAFGGNFPPVVFFDSFVEGSDISRVVVDDRDGAFKAIDYLLSLGHERIAHVGGLNDTTARRRLDGYASALKARGLTVDDALIKSGDYTRDWGIRAAREIRGEQSDVTAFFCGNDTIAAGVSLYLRNAGVKCPGDASVIGFGDTPIAADLGLTTVAQPYAAIADAAWTAMRKSLDGDQPQAETVLGTELIVRASTAAPSEN